MVMYFVTEVSGSDGAADFWRTYSAYTSGYQSVDHLSDIDEAFEESFRYLSVVDKTKHYYTLCKTGSPVDTPAATPNLTPKRVGAAAAGGGGGDEGIGDEEEEEEVLKVEKESSDAAICDDGKGGEGRLQGCEGDGEQNDDDDFDVDQV